MGSRRKTGKKDNWNAEFEELEGNNNRHGACMESKMMNLKEIGTFISTFSGSEGEMVELFLEQIMNTMEVFEVDEKKMKLIMLGKLGGNVLQWFRSKPDYIKMDFSILVEEIRRMWTTKKDRIAMRKNFEQRCWKRSETFGEYFHNKLILGNQLNLEDEEILDYMIDGLNNAILQTQARMQNIKTSRELFNIMSRIPEANRKLLENTSSKSSVGCEGKQAVSSKIGSSKNSETKCYNCGKIGHISPECPQPKLPKGSCYGCGEQGHMMNRCPKKKEKTQINNLEVSNLIPSYKLDLNL